MKVKNQLNGKGSKGKFPAVKSRKELRKEKRNAKKQHRRDYYSRRFKSGQQNLVNVGGNNSLFGSDIKHVFKQQSDEGYEQHSRQNIESDDFQPRHLFGNNENYRKQDATKSHVKNTTNKYQDPLIARKMEEEVAHQELQKEMRESRKQQLNVANEEEERLIKRLEKQLKLSKRKSKTVPKSFTDDGLDYLLDICDSDKIKDVANLEHAYRNSDSELEEDLALASGKKSLAMQIDEDNNLVRPGTSGLNNKRLNSSGASDNGINASGYESDSDFVDSAAESDHDGSSVYGSGDSGKNDDGDEYFDSDDEHIAKRMHYTYENSGHNDNVDEGIPKRGITDSCKKAYPLTGKNLKNVRFMEDDDDDDDDDNDEDSVDNELSKNSSWKSVKRMKMSQKGKRANDRKKLKVTHENIDHPGRYVLMHHSDDASGDDETNASDIDDSAAEERNKGIWEDIYGRMRDKAGNVLPSSSQTGAYVPPALRAQQSSGDAETQQRLQRLKRQVKGLLNRLTERNLPSISNEMDLLYSNNSRSDMNSTFTGILMESLVSAVLSLERLIMEHAALIACLHSKVGNDVGAYVLQAVAIRFDTLFKANPDIENKELDNVIQIMCYLYHFKVVHARMLFDILHCLAARFNSKDVELILLVLRSVGFGLRKDDPATMKSLMIQLQELANTSIQHCNESRVKFMLEVLVAVKNNNMARLPGWDPTPVENMRKLLRSLLASGNTSPELNISLQDLLLADERGRWWVVGSAWVGQTPGASEQQEQQSNTPRTVFSAQLLELAERMRMNTEVRRNIFCILMSAHDYTEAFKNLMQLGLKGLQVREIVHVTLDCCLQERTYNPFYAHVLQSLCEHNRIFKMTLQCDFWNKFEDLKSATEIQFGNLVQLLLQLLTQGVISVVVFKVIDLTRLEKPTIRLLRQVLLGVLSSDFHNCNQVFGWLTKHPKYKIFSRKLHVFLQQFVLNKIPDDDSQRALLQERIDGMFLSQDL